MEFQPKKVYVAASWMAPVGRYNGREREALSFLELAERAGEVFAGSPVRSRDIEAVVVGSQSPAAFSGVDNTAAKVAGVLGISGAKSVLIDTASSSGASALENAYLEIASGRSDHVLAIGIQKMSDVSTVEATRIVAGVIDRDEAEFGLTMPACGALVARALMERLHLTEEEWTAYSFGPINMVDLGVLPRHRLMDGLLDDELTGEKGLFPTNVTGGLKGRGHPLGATGMIQVVENHRPEAG